MTPFLFFSYCPFLPQHEEGMGLIEDNEINNNTLAGVWITTGKNHGHVTTIYDSFSQRKFQQSFNIRGGCRIFQGEGRRRRYLGLVE